ncbi:TPA: SGNH/GDSL hydrolase family protein [Clostridioides difficile]|uniref:SGNH/GDSL hydrolase family protein n=1 Tax=Clostridioides difficile TaxID=1496 RepID=UPI0010B9B949|nr:SGNH/GDSL hydrolase family protein [Clostridioides difficile]MCK3713521.1 SGNH/GDSL hydrolase family protein [Clostridioides difficile]VHX84915.1 GDSL-like Lipase/Acylhydrolase [Clostridioides difficile]
MKKSTICFLLVTMVSCITSYMLVDLNNSSSVFSDTQNNTSLESTYFNKWKGKSWITLGDSITRANGYQDKLKNILGFSRIDNMGENGQTMVSQSKTKSTYTLGKTIDYKVYDLATIFIGTNDFRYNKKLGKIKASGSIRFDETTFTGSYQLLIEKILSSNPSIDLVLITPPQRIRDGYDIDFTNEVGSKLIDYVNVIKSLGEMYSLPVLDLYSEGGISKKNISTFTRDGLHPNDVGYDRISDKMYRFLLSI